MTVRRAKKNPFHKGDIVREFGGGPPLEVVRRRGDQLWVRSLKKHGRQYIELHGPYQVFVRYTVRFDSSDTTVRRESVA